MSLDGASLKIRCLLMLCFCMVLLMLFFGWCFTKDQVAVDAFFWPSLTFALISSKDETMVIRTFSQVEETKTKQRVGLESVLSEYLLSQSMNVYSGIYWTLRYPTRLD